MAEKTVTIPLDEPITIPGKDSAETVTAIVLREPRYPDIMALGNPTAFARSPEGMVYTAEKDDTIKAYIERLLVEPKNVIALHQLGPADTFKLRDAVHGFFSISPT